VRYCTTIDFPGNRLGRTLRERARIAVTAANVATTFVECGPIECPDDPVRHELVRLLLCPTALAAGVAVVAVVGPAVMWADSRGFRGLPHCGPIRPAVRCG